METATLAQMAEKNIQALPKEARLFPEKHLALFRERGFKTYDEESYRYTNLNSFFADLSPAGASVSKLDKSKFSSIPTLFVIDGKIDTIPTVAGLKIKPQQNQYHDDFFPHPRLNAATNLHHSLLNDSVMITVEKNAQVKEPLRILYVSTHAEVTAPTIYVNAEIHSEFTLIEEHLSLSSCQAHLSETFILVDKGAKLEHIQVGNGEETLTHASTYAHVNQDASFKSFFFNLAGKLNRRNLDIKLAAAGSNGESYNLYLTQGKEHSDINTVIEHCHADTTSNQLAKGILDGESKGIFTGKIHIHPQAQRVASGQLNKNLLLSKKAQAHSQPQLEIFADDVKCSHGSTTGQLSPEELFYFQARGIPAEKARTLLAHGFALEVVTKINNKMACQLLSEVIHSKLEQKFKL